MPPAERDAPLGRRKFCGVSEEVEGWAVITRPFDRVRGPEGTVGGGDVTAWI